jgi:hypothetical protein
MIIKVNIVLFIFCKDRQDRSQRQDRSGKQAHERISIRWLAIPRVTSDVSAAPSPYHRNDTEDGAGRRRDNDRRDRDGGRGGRRGREGRGQVSLETQVRPVSLVASLT